MTKEEKIYLRTLCPKCSEFVDIEYVDEELQALRDWKAKARPFLETNLAYFKLLKDSSSCNTSKINELTELLGGSDDTAKAS